ncbi:MAG TPA: alpha/beta hydrolase [Gammaproteobacteria bacterium]
MNSIFPNTTRAACILLLAIATSACLPETLEHEIIQSAEENEQGNAGNNADANEERLTCVAIGEMLVADLPVSDATSTNAYEAQSFSEWCAANITADDRENRIGNAAAWKADETDPVITAASPFGRATRPTLAQGARLEIHILDPRGTIPFIRKIHFANWEGPKGVCQLEMRVYQENIGETGKKPLLYFHGGGWHSRTTTLTAAEVLTSHLVDEHVVFMPAYPLHESKDGPAECRKADFEDILTVAQQAFDWVIANKDVFGATGAVEIDVMGHSAGGQLAAWIATQNRARIGKLVNFYGPVEFAQFIDESHPGGLYADSLSGPKELLASLLDVESLATLERPYGELVMQNSLTEIIETQGAGAVPPFFMVQGNADTTVPVEQALGACNALGGHATSEGGLYSCPNDSRVAIIEGAGHNLDRRCVGGDWPLDGSGDEDVENVMDTICPTGDIDHGAVRTAVGAAFDWLGE